MSEWNSFPLSKLAQVHVSNVDKKSNLGEMPVRLCNYMDVYSNDYISASIDFMASTASAAECVKFKVEQGDVLITKDSETPYDIGIPAVVIEDIENLICGYHLALIKPDKDLVNPIFLSKQIASQDAVSYFSRMAAGSTRYGLSNGVIAQIKISIPSRAQQNKISMILFKCDQAIEKTEALIEKHQHIKAGLMHDLFTRGITADGKLRLPREQVPELYQETPIGWIPKEWEVASLEYYLDSDVGLKPGPFGSSLKKDSFVEFGYKVYGQEQVISNNQSFGDYYINKQKHLSLQGFSVAENDILVSLVGTIGKVLVIRSPYEAGIINPRLMRVRPNLAKVSVEFLKYILISNDMKRQLEQLAGGGTMPVLNAKIVRAVKVPIIQNLEEQAGISTLLDKAELKVTTELQILSKLQKQKSGLMNDLLTGKVSVKVGEAEVANV